MRARSGPRQLIRVILQGVGRIWARGNYLSQFSVCGPGTQPELGQNLSKVVAQRWARQILLSGREWTKQKIICTGRHEDCFCEFMACVHEYAKQLHFLRRTTK